MKIAFATLLAALFLSASAAHASAILTGSNYGPGPDYQSLTPEQCAESGGNCISFVTDASSVEIGGTSTEVNVYGYSEGTTASGVFDVVEFDLAAGASVDVPLVNTSPALTGVFGCGTSTPSIPDTTPNSIKDSLGTFYTFPCTADTLVSDISSPGVLDPTKTGLEFTNNDNVAVEVAIVTPVGNLSGGTTTTPEPSSMLLLVTGLIPLAFFAKRRLKA